MTADTEYKAKHDAMLAGIGQRFVARIIDSLIVGCLMAVMFSWWRETGGGIALVISVLYEWYCLTRRDGQTIGKTVMNIRVVKANGSPMSDLDAVIRSLLYYVSTGILFLGLLWALVDERRRGWHDILAGTLVVKS